MKKFYILALMFAIIIAIDWTAPQILESVSI